MAGVPPTLGFFAKVGVLHALIHAHYVWLACLAMFFAVLGAYYYLRVVKVMYFDEPTTLTVIQPSLDAHVAIGVNALALLILGLFPSVLITLSQSMVFGM